MSEQQKQENQAFSGQWVICVALLPVGYMPMLASSAMVRYQRFIEIVCLILMTVSCSQQQGYGTSIWMLHNLNQDG